MRRHSNLKLPKVKSLFKSLAITAILTVVIPSIASSVSLQFSTQAGEKQVSNFVSTVDEKAIANVATSIRNTDFQEEDEISDLANTIRDYGNQTANENDHLSDFQKASLVRVIDGDTIVVDVYGDHCGNKSHEYTVRLIGVDAAESVAPEEYLEKTGKRNTEEGKAASEFVNNLIENAEYLYLQKDASETDKYGRLLRYVWIDIPYDDEDLEEISEKMLNAILIREKMAIPAFYNDTSYQEEFYELANENNSDYEIEF